MSADVGPDVSAWCRKHLGSDVSRVLLRAGYFSEVLGVGLLDGRVVVVKVRPAAPRLADCASVQSALHAGGFPAPRLLAGPAPCGEEREASAEALVVAPANGRSTPHSSASLLAEQIRLAGPAHAVALAPPPAWVSWQRNDGELWPVPDDEEVDMNSRRIHWIDSAAAQAGAILSTYDEDAVIGHVDWIPQNVWWHPDGTPAAVLDWDSLAVLPEPAVAGVAAAIYRDDATADDTRQFLDAYVHAAGPWSAAQIRIAWAAGLWVRLFDAKKDLLAGRTNPLRPEHVDECLHRAGVAC